MNLLKNKNIKFTEIEKNIRTASLFLIPIIILLPSFEIFGVNLRLENIVVLAIVPFILKSIFKKKFEVNLFDFAFFFLGFSFFATIIYSYLINGNPFYWRDFLDIFRVFNYYLIYRFVFDNLNIKKRSDFGKFFLLSGAVVLLVAICQYFDLFYVNNLLGYYTSTFHIRGVLVSGRPIGTFGHTNEFGFFVSVYLIYLISLFLFTNFKFKKENLKKNGVLFLLSLFAFIALFMSMSRSALIALFIGLSAMVFLYIVFHHGKDKLKNLFFAIMIIFITSLFSIAFVKWLSSESNRVNIADRFEAGFYELSEDEGEDVLSSKSFSKRLVQWVGAIDVISENPLFGYGPSKATKGSDSRPELVENEYLNIAMNYGVLGLMAYLFIYMFMIRVVLKSLAKDKDKKTLPYSYWVVGIIAAVFIYNIFLGVYYRTQSFNILLMIFVIPLLANRDLLEISINESQKDEK